MIVVPAIANAVSRVTAVVVNLVTTAIALTYLGEEMFGVWMVVISGVTLVAALGDGGVGQGLVTTVAKLRSSKGDAAVGEAVSAASVIAALATAVLLVLFGLAWMSAIWEKPFVLSDQAAVRDVGQTILVVIVGTLVGIWANIMTNTRHGLEQIRQVSLWNIFGSLLVIPLVILTVELELPLAWVAAMVLYPPIVVRLIVHGHFIWKRPKFRPAVSRVNRDVVGQVAKNGGAFFIIAVTQALAIQSDQLIISYFHGPVEVTPYSLLNRLFLLPVFMATALSNVFWPRLARLNAAGNTGELRREFLVLLTWLTVGGLVATAVLWLALEAVLRLWVGYVPDYDRALELGMVAYSLIVIPTGVVMLLIISLEKRRVQLACSVTMAVLNLGLTIATVPHLGAGGAVLSTVTAYLICLLIPLSIIAYRAIKVTDPA